MTERRQRRLGKALPLIILVGLLLVAWLILRNPPQVERRPPGGGAQMVVQTAPIQRSDYPVVLQSYGIVQPRTQSVLVAQVGGQIISVSPSFRSGGFFERGDVLATIDPRDYEANVKIAEAAVLDAREGLADAEVRTEQARRDWDGLGNPGTPSDFVLRLPQLDAAKARVTSAQSSLEKARLDLERTKIVAPFAGRALRKLADVGQVVSSNTQLAEIYASDYLEVRLPLKNSDLPFVRLPEAYRYEQTEQAGSGDPVTIRSELGGGYSWAAQLVRTEGAIDETARQLHVIAQIEDPFGEVQPGRVPLKIGQYVTAELTGLTVSDAIAIPTSAIYQGSYVYLVEDGLLRRRDIDIRWQNDREALIGSGLTDGDQLVTTPLGQVTSGIPVAIEGTTERDGSMARSNPRGDQRPRESVRPESISSPASSGVGGRKP